MEFYDLVKAIGESKSKQEEDRIILDEIVFLKKTFSQHVSNKKKLKEYVIRALYVEMLGHDATFAYVKAVEICASTNIVQKRAGYLVASLCFSPDHEFRLMLVNQIQRDMNSSNQLEVAAALSAVCKIVTEDMIPAIVSIVIKLLKHEFETVRKKAVCALHRLYQMDKHCIQEHTNTIRLMICDRDPSVMGATLPLLYDLCKEHTNEYKDLIPSLVSIIKQVSEHRLPKEYDYHRVPAPWIQMQLLKILALLGRGDKTASEGMYEVLVNVMRTADIGVNIGYAIVYECVITITTIYPNPILLDTAATSISRFIRSESNNLKYIGIKGLTAIVHDNPQYVTDHQLAVIDCLEDPDETLKRKTLHLLFRITNAVNIEFIIEKLLSFLSQVSATTDDFFREALVTQITQCAETFAPSNAWYVSVMVKLFGLAGDKVKMSVAQTFMQLIADGSEDEDDEEDDDDDNNKQKEEDEGKGKGLTESKDDPLRREAVEGFLLLISQPKLSDTVTQCAIWVLGEYSYLSTSHTLDSIIDKLCKLFHTSPHNDTTRAQIVTAIMKIVAQYGQCPKCVIDIVTAYQFSQSLEIQQRCMEFDQLLKHSSTRSLMAEVLPVDASCEDIQVDMDLSFLDGYVQSALKKGALPYAPPQNLHISSSSSSQRNGLKSDGAASAGGSGGAGSSSSGLRTAAYEKPTIPTSVPSVTGGSSLFIGMSPSTVTSLTPDSSTSSLVIPGTSPGTSSILTANLRVPGSGLNSSSGPGNQLLNYRVGGQVWGKKIELTPPPPPSVPAPTQLPTTPSPLSLTGQQSAAVAYGLPVDAPVISPYTPQQAALTRVKSEKEKMAAALFSGVAASKSPYASSAAGASTDRSAGLSATGSRHKQTLTAANTPSTPAATISIDTRISPSASSVALAHPVSPLIHMAPSPTATSTSSSVSAGVSMFSGLQTVALPPSVYATNNTSLQEKYDSAMHTSSTASASASVSVLVQHSSTPNSSVKGQSTGDSLTASAHSVSSLNGRTAAEPSPSVSASPSTSTLPAVTGTATTPVHPSTSSTTTTIAPSSISQNTAINNNNSSSSRSPNMVPFPLKVHPLTMTTPEFGAKWGQQPAELKSSCTCTIYDMDHLSQVMPRGYYHVQSITATNEAIFAAVTGIGSVVLIHMKLQPQRRGCEVTARSSNKQICQEHVQALTTHITNSV